MKEEKYVVAIEEVVNRVVESKSLDADEETRHFQGWYSLVNTFGTEILSFSGCIAIEGLPFDMWNEETFKYSGQQSGGLQDIEQKTKNFSNLSESESN